MNSADHAVELAAIRQVELQRVATSVLVVLLDRLRDLERTVNLAILKHDPTGVVRSNAKAARMVNLLDEIREAIRDVLRQMSKFATEDFDELLEIQLDDERRNLWAVFGLDVTWQTTVTAATLLIAGATLRQWFQQIERETTFRVNNAIRSGVAIDETASEIVRRVTGTPTLVHKEGELTRTGRAIETVIRTGITALPGAVLKDIPDAIPGSRFGEHGWQQISVLDNRTTEICRAYAWRKWDATYEPVGHKLPFQGGPPRHPNCRSRVVMVFLSDPEPAHVTFQQFVERLSPGRQTEIFGSKQLRLWRSGVITDSELIRQANRPLSIDALRKLTEEKPLPATGR